MIRYTISLPQLEQRIERHRPGWLARAAARTQHLRTAGRYDEKDDIWSEIKPVFMELQHNKCAFCERQFAAASSPGGTAELDVEHFRPKSMVADWPGANAFPLRMGRPHPTGYHWLAYHLLNYAVACKVCNSGLKADHFPIAGRRGRSTQDPISLYRSERPYLLYPISDLDADPQELITFDGVNAIPASPSGWPRQRAEVTIAFFRLNDTGDPSEFREELFRERAVVLEALSHYLGTLNSGREPKWRKDEAKDSVARALSAGRPHSSCAMAYTELYQHDPDKARSLADAARAYLDTLG